MKIFGILLILGTVYSTPPFIQNLYNRMVKDLMSDIVLAAERNETGIVSGIFQLPEESDKKTVLEIIQILKIVKFDIIAAKFSYDHQTLEARMNISGRIEKVFPKFSTTWIFKRNRNSPIGWIVDKIRTSNLEKRRFGPGESGWETAACATEPLICAILAKKKNEIRN
ncbi:hypothetical protein B9Z55_021211 [Caenorhabditis nigoni]|uniref:Uncharacterized protein n=1 Tax=Caenorhabditis nigoni TaxID=1611254 RepID=A0A2G5TQY0_9PELO|nr:hypothetical protein B9Z55_021211 [Caenorhabditis nigoni]